MSSCRASATEVAGMVRVAAQDSADAELLRGLQPQVAVNHLAAAAREHRDFESKLLNRCAHAIDGGVVFARVACIRNEPGDWPKLDRCVAKHTRAALP